MMSMRVTRIPQFVNCVQVWHKLCRISPLTRTNRGVGAVSLRTFMTGHASPDLSSLRPSRPGWTATSSRAFQQRPRPSTVPSQLQQCHHQPSQRLHTSSLKLLRAGGSVDSTKVNMEATDEAVVRIVPSSNPRTVELSEVNGRTTRFHANWLRHNCHCEACKQSHSGQIVVHPHQRLPLYTIAKADITGSDLHLHLEEEPGHVTVVPLEFLWENDYSREARAEAERIREPVFSKEGFPELTYEELTASPAGKLRWLEAMNKYGMCVLRNVPPEDGMVKQVAEMIWPVQRTIYGEVFDVVSTPKPINVAYSTAELGFHMDLVYYESPPGLQMLHAIRYDEVVEGGQSLFVDSWAVAEQLREQFPEDFDNLTRIPATFQKIHYDRDHPVHMQYRTPHIALNPQGKVIAVTWAPPFEGPLFVPEEDVEPYFRSYHRFAQMIEESDTKVEMRLRVGDLVSFNNRRILHARRAFTLNGGMRHFQGCYINLDEFKSEVEVMSRTAGKGEPACHVGNHSYH